MPSNAALMTSGSDSSWINRSGVISNWQVSRNSLIAFPSFVDEASGLNPDIMATLNEFYKHHVLGNLPYCDIDTTKPSLTLVSQILVSASKNCELNLTIHPTVMAQAHRVNKSACKYNILWEMNR